MESSHNAGRCSADNNRVPSKLLKLPILSLKWIIWWSNSQLTSQEMSSKQQRFAPAQSKRAKELDPQALRCKNSIRSSRMGKHSIWPKALHTSMLTLHTPPHSAWTILWVKIRRKNALVTLLRLGCNPRLQVSTKSRCRTGNRSALTILLRSFLFYQIKRRIYKLFKLIKKVNNGNNFR